MVVGTYCRCLVLQPGLFVAFFEVYGKARVTRSVILQRCFAVARDCCRGITVGDGGTITVLQKILKFSDFEEEAGNVFDGSQCEIHSNWFLHLTKRTTPAKDYLKTTCHVITVDVATRVVAH